MEAEEWPKKNKKKTNKKKKIKKKNNNKKKKNTKTKKTQKKKQWRAGIIQNVSDVRWTQGGWGGWRT